MKTIPALPGANVNSTRIGGQKQGRASRGMGRTSVVIAFLILLGGLGIRLRISDGGAGPLSKTQEGKCFPVTSEVESPDETILLRACSLRESHGVGVPLRVAVLIQNVGTEPFTIRPNFWFGSWLLATVVDPTGKRLVQGAQLNVPYTTENPVTLAPSAFTGKIIDLRCPDRLPNGECISVYSFDKQGNYNVTFRFRILCDSVECEPGEYREILAPTIAIRME